MLWGWNCIIQPYSCLIMGSSYVEFNAPDIEGSLPVSFPLLNKNTCIWSTFNCDPNDGSSILQTTVSFVSCQYPKPVGYYFLAKFLGFMIHVYNIYPDSEICVVVLYRTELDYWLPDGSSTLFFRS